ncbi:5-formyltetrahydrofolate cyclo-ligase [Actinomadura sp. DC4]|uniref:5-formyltetrahydrofolate cyclo-ligase n=1 Tax=Actinomadura sp. DC4 TaxID=3055069 RepID=UPI0025B0A19A|nr:5-formyltetrahydrofolate cyclo-ligase [Actinomadura sp. DC4]MDN3351198.1 5-formyltetrahydrofolate cyclo-ligase [Actinomadura sp. DC4]
MGIDQDKQVVRDKAWRLLDREGVVPGNSYGKIPAFSGAELAAERLAGTPEWGRAVTIKANPDFAQLPVRVRALNDGKLVYMAVPKIAGEQPFFLLDPTDTTVDPRQAAEKRSAGQNAPRVGIEEMRPIDMVICGSVAVNRSGARLGKGAGYSDLEVALLVEAGLVTSQTVIVAPVHRLQVIDDVIPETTHDFSVDLIVTPEQVIRCGNPRRPEGIIGEALKEEQITTIPLLSKRRASR